MALKASYLSGVPLLELMKEIQETAPTVRLGMFTCLTSGCFVTRLGSTVEQRCELWRTVRERLDFAVMGRYDQTQPANCSVADEP